MTDLLKNSNEIELSWQMVPQLDSGLDSKIQLTASTVKATLTTTFISLMASKLLFGMSLKKVWPLLVTLQVQIFIID